MLVLAALATSAVAAQNANPGIAPPGSHAHGQSYGEWATDYWQWFTGIPLATNPILDTTGELARAGQSGSVWFLVESIENVVRTVTIPAGTALVVPVQTSIWVQFPGEPVPTIDEIRQTIAQFEDSAVVTCEIDGRPVPNLDRYRVQSPVFGLTIPGAGYLLPANTPDFPAYYPCVVDGYILLLQPLSVGHHTIHWTSDFLGSFTETIYDITVSPGK